MNRTPEYIYMVCMRLAQLWCDVPQWRLGQLLDNFKRTIGNDCFYLEDDEFIKRLNKYTEERHNPPKS